MNTELNKETNTSSVLAEIFMKPSNEIINDRFHPSSSNQAPCNNTCEHGSCR